MGSTLHSLEKACGALAGLSAMIFTDMSNVANYGPGYLPPAPGSPVTFSDNDLVYAISFERGSAAFGTDSQHGQIGDYGIHQMTGFIPLSRAVVEVLLRRLRNRPVLVIGIDRLGNQHVIYEARARYKHGTGDRAGTRHGYSLTFTGASHFLLPSISGEGDIETAPPIGGVVPSDPGSSDCCVTIQPTNIAYTPAPTGNTMNKNELVTTLNGSVYFIDGDGRGLLINRPAPVYYQHDAGTSTITEVTLPMSYPLPDPDDYAAPTYDPVYEMSIRLRVKVGSRWLTYEHAEGWTVDHATQRVLFNSPIRGGVIEFYSYQGIPATPV